jgi:hypothetical protein
MEAAPAYRGDLRTSRLDRWGHDRRTATTVHPCIGAGLRSVGHTELTKLNSTESTLLVTD